MRYSLSFLLIITAFVGKAQTYNPTKIKPKAIAAYSKAMQYLSVDAHRFAIPYLEDAIAKDPNYVDAYLSLGGVQGELKNYGESVRNYEIAKSKDSIYLTT